MLDFLPKFAELLLSSIADLLPHILIAPPLRPGIAQFTPQDPSTLGLAVAGIATLAIYFAASGWRKARGDSESKSLPESDVSKRQPAIDRTETPNRGAA